MESAEVDRLFGITGGPGSGKSTLIDALTGQGISGMPEAGRAIIRDQVAIAGEALPWADRRAFAELMLSWELRSYRVALGCAGPVMFDRGIPDVAGYLRLNGLAVPAHVNNAARMFRYHRRVFVAPPWLQIFSQDAERKQSFEEARATCDAMIEIYSTFGYELITLPLGSLEQRVQFVVSAIGAG